MKFRPHVKTTQCVEVARAQAAAGAQGITVSTLKEAERFFATGFSNILHAVGAARAVGRFGKEHRHGSELWIEIDCDGHRSGIAPEAQALIEVGGAVLEGGSVPVTTVVGHRAEKGWSGGWPTYRRAASSASTKAQCPPRPRPSPDTSIAVRGAVHHRQPRRTRARLSAALPAGAPPYNMTLRLHPRQRQIMFGRHPIISSMARSHFCTTPPCVNEVKSDFAPDGRRAPCLSLNPVSPS